MQYTCCGSNGGSYHCESNGLIQCDYCHWYQSGCGLPHYPVPAIPIECWVCWGKDQGKPYAYVDIVYHDHVEDCYTLINELAKAPLS